MPIPLGSNVASFVISVIQAVLAQPGRKQYAGRFDAVSNLRAICQRLWHLSSHLPRPVAAFIGTHAAFFYLSLCHVLLLDVIGRLFLILSLTTGIQSRCDDARLLQRPTLGC
jgi:hypothetical protein